MTPATLEEFISSMKDETRVYWIKALVKDIQEEGTIQKIREIVNDPLLDD